MFRHHDVSGDVESVMDSRLLQCQFEQVARPRAGQKRLTTVATECEEVEGHEIADTASVPKACRNTIESVGVCQ